jgi:hypothetical protein
MPLDPTHVRLKLLHACNQWHSFLNFTPLTGSHCKFRPNTKGHCVGAGVAQLVALRLLGFVDSMEETETRKDVMEAEMLASLAETPAEHDHAASMLQAALNLDRTREQRATNLDKMARIRVVCYGSPVICDHVFGKAAQQLIAKAAVQDTHANNGGGCTFTFFAGHCDLIPMMLAALTVYETGIHEQVATNNNSRRTVRVLRQKFTLGGCHWITRLLAS